MKAFKRFEPKTATVEVTGALLDELNDLAPGQAFRLSGRDGRQYAILDWEDFAHILDKANMDALDQESTA